MNTVYIWILIPILISLVIFIIKSKLLEIIISSFTATTLSILALLVSDNLVIKIGNLSFELKESIFIFGRSLEISPTKLPIVSLIYFISLLWIIGSSWFNISKRFRVASFLISPLLVAAISVQPFLYAAFLFEIIVMTYIPVLSEGQKDSKSGPLRFLIFQTFALPLVIFSGILLSGIDTAPAESPIIIQATILLMLGFTFWLGIFPFHSWLPMISTTSKPWIVSFLLISMPTIYIFFLLTFFDRYAWLRTIPMVNNAILFIGILMIVTAGVLIALENHLSKVLGYSIILDNGFSLLTIGLMADGGLPWLSYMIIPRVIAYFLWGFSLTILSEKYESLTFEKTQGLLYSSPITFIGIFIAQMSLAGLPLLASFPAKQLIWLSVTEKNSIQGLLVILGNFGLIIFSLRLLSNSLTLKDKNQDKTWQLDPVKFIIPISICILVLFLIGIFPHFFLKDSPSLLNSFNIIFNK